MTTYYLHTINGLPAAFHAESGQICFINKFGRAPKLAKSLLQIRKEQKLTKAFRTKFGWEFNESEYGYTRVST